MRLHRATSQRVYGPASVGRAVDDRPWLRRLTIALAPWPLVRPGFSPAEIRRSRKRAATRIAYLIVYFSVAVSLAVFVPWLLLPLGVAAAFATAVELSYARPSYGRRRGLPPGRLPLVAFSPGVDHEFYAAEGAGFGRVYKTITAVLSEPTACVIGLPQGLSIMREHDGKLGPTGVSFDPLIPRKLLRSMSPDDHREYRRVLQSAFRDDVVLGCLPRSTRSSPPAWPTLRMQARSLRHVASNRDRDWRHSS